MRVTSNSMVGNLLYDLREAASRLEDSERQLTSLKRINKPSDDPTGTVNALRLKNTLLDTDRYTSNIEDAQSWLDATENAVGSLESVLTSALSLATQANTVTLTGDERTALADQVDQLIRAAVDVGNSSFSGRSLFGGFQTNLKPATIVESGGSVTQITLGGDAGKIQRQISPDSTMTVNYTQQDLVGSGTTIYESLLALKSAVQSGDPTALSQASAAMESHHTRIVGIQTEIGAKGNRLTSTKDRLADTKLSLAELLSKVEDTDVAELSVKVQAAQTSYESVLAVGAKIIQPTLMDFLR